MTAVAATSGVRLAVVGTLLVLSGFATGCQSDTEGTPVTSSKSPTEPSFPTTRPTAKPPTTAAPSIPRTPISPPAAAEALPPDDSGYVFIETKSGQTRCQIDEKSVGCEAPFTNSPLQNGVRANGVNLSAAGDMQWIVGNLGDIPAVTIDYRTYSAVGWTILATSDGTRFTNQATKHGMFVSIEKVEVF
jgi:hypothetical protein